MYKCYGELPHPINLGENCQIMQAVLDTIRNADVFS